MKRLDGKVAIITGGISGIGKAVAQDFLNEGAKVVITGRREKLGQEVAQELGTEDQIIYLPQDVSNEEDWNRVVQETKARFGQWNILVNNAGVGGPGKLITETTKEEWQNVMDINLTGNFLGVKKALIEMDQGSIVNISSVLGITVPMPGVGAYAASKGGTRTLTKAGASEAIKLDKNIRVNSVHPGLVATDILPEAYRTAATNTGDVIPTIGQPVDVAKAVTYLASDEAQYTTGSELLLDGGVVAGGR
ncbi:glucose 1-dehydrogenase [Fructobacillus ficulneus]|uniref:Short-chain alcohol dehydrogenase n=1 Tax=Fructobacillus ficulneus TaxID=157463 RepID=A0A0K8MIF4_9LACO|nr:glucose 1-dehydrogenase [Fructobacillus ficulneus]GAP00341.1 short-chain alcohol dehydrogenase [Fructobacillus ficulneus]